MNSYLEFHRVGKLFKVLVEIGNFTLKGRDLFVVLLSLDLCITFVPCGAFH